MFSCSRVFEDNSHYNEFSVLMVMLLLELLSGFLQMLCQMESLMNIII